MVSKASKLETRSWQQRFPQRSNSGNGFKFWWSNASWSVISKSGESFDTISFVWLIWWQKVHQKKAKTYLKIAGSLLFIHKDIKGKICVSNELQRSRAYTEIFTALKLGSFLGNPASNFRFQSNIKPKKEINTCTYFKFNRKRFPLDSRLELGVDRISSFQLYLTLKKTAVCHYHHWV